MKKIPPNVGSITITENGTYKASEEDLDGDGEVEVTTSGVDVDDYFQRDWLGSFIKKEDKKCN